VYLKGFPLWDEDLLRLVEKLLDAPWADRLHYHHEVLPARLGELCREALAADAWSGIRAGDEKPPRQP